MLEIKFKQLLNLFKKSMRVHQNYKVEIHPHIFKDT